MRPRGLELAITASHPGELFDHPRCVVRAAMRHKRRAWIPIRLSNDGRAVPVRHV